MEYMQRATEPAGSELVIRGLPVSARSFADTVDLLASWTTRPCQPRFFACVNAHSAETAHRDAHFMAALQAADLLVADGFGVILASRLLRSPISERSTGPDLFMALSKRLNAIGGRSVFYLGGTPASLERILARHEEMFPSLRVAGSLAPPYRNSFTGSDLDAMLNAVTMAAPDVLWVGLGAPKQEKWIHAHAARLQVPLCGPIGAMFDYFAGTVPRPPRWVEQAGLHWAYRLAREPCRLWRRNLDSPLFLVRVAAERLWRSSEEGRPAPPTDPSRD
jgi:N-acetylglucosaminyldiphosphoundecaprenol N-acetyl-beta-D-mannosaminyltransferase